MGTVPPPPELPPEHAPAAQPAEELMPEESAADEPAPPRGRRRRLPALLACAALLGVVAGVATGYTVQAARKPTVLPPLSQHTLTYPRKRLPADKVEALPAEHDHLVTTDGDLRKLLLPKPKGAHKADLILDQNGWLSVADYARHYQEPDRMFRTLSTDVRRIATRSWQQHGLDVSIDLIQFQDFGIRHSANFTTAQQSYMHLDEFAGYEGKDLPGSGNGRYWGDHTAHREPGYLPQYEARALAYRGDVVMDVHVYDTHPISEKTVRTLAEKQLERL